MGDIAIALLRAIGYPLLRHQSVFGVVVWIALLLLVSGVGYVVVGWFHNRNVRDSGRHEREDPCD